ncbi:MAG: FHA domain-containing protein, partial [Myxococcales bacterium]|nr:FHA domain-containing protein [Myxococcales bacterium]
MSGRAYLFLEADRRVYRCQFTKDLTLIGSASDADIIIRDSQVLPQHAQIAMSGTTFTLRRIDRSEVRVDGVRIEGPHELVAGERIGIGDTEILFVREEKLSPVCLELVVERPGDVPVGFWTAKSTVTIGRERGDLILDD